MTTKADFNAEEWSTVVNGPLLAGMRVITAGRGGTIRESMAMGKVYGHAREQHGRSELLDELVASPPALDPARARSPEEIARLSAEGLRSAMSLLESKVSPEEAEAYRRFTLDVARAAAEAHKEGGFLGIGGRQVSEEEQAALDELAGALGGS